MRRRSLVWILISLACFIGAVYFWRKGNEWGAQKSPTENPPVPAAETNAAASGVESSFSTVQSASTSPMALLGLPQTNGVAGTNAASARLKYRLTNTSQPIDDVLRSDHGISLANALIDSSRPLGLAIPDSLRAKGDPGAYVVQARGPINKSFRARLAEAGATIVSYIPNNAFLVRASAGAARQLSALPETQAVLPFEPYYKLESGLLAAAIESRPLPGDNTLNVVVFPDAHVAAIEALNRLGAEIVSEERSPFGPMFKVRAPTDSLTQLAGIPEVQTIGLATPRRSANDLSRQRIGVATNSVAPDNYLGLTGDKVLVQENDTGVDASHPALVNRVFSQFAGSLTDLDGHGTHVAGIIAGDGANSDTVTAASGSVMPPVAGQFRGMAPAANILIQPLSLSDLRLQETGARSNALVMNNAWNYGTSDYDIAAANYDAAVRDSLTTVTGSQSMVIVFSAGNAGNGFSDGSGVTDGSILSPATAKNVITVGAIEQVRNITNETQIVVNGQTNISHPWVDITDSDSQIAPFSSRGNVGAQIEGEFGRFKPDVSAPGVFVVSTTWQDQSHWDMTNYYNPVFFHANSFIESVKTNSVNSYAIFLPFNTIQFGVSAIALNPVVDLPVYVKQNGLPTPADPPSGTNQFDVPNPSPVDTFWFYGVGNPTNRAVRYQVTASYTTTNDSGNYFLVLSNLNANLGDPNAARYYRYESGTSMAAAGVSGMLALMEDYFTNKASPPMRPSPALMKAMLINGSRTVNAMYDLKVRKTLNDQGWGLINLTNSLPFASNSFTAAIANGPASIILREQNPTNALITGDSHTLFVKVNTNSISRPLRVTLVWTDPPGNPAAGVKLVNDLDLVVTNLDNPDPKKQLVYYGNNIPAGSSFNAFWDTNTVPPADIINNVENVYIQNPVGTNYSITVIGRRVNVNAVTAHTNDVAQDFAMVISSGDGSVPDSITVGAPQPPEGTLSGPLLNITAMTNQFAATPAGSTISGQLLLGQHVGANSPLVGTNTTPLATNTVFGTANTNGFIRLGVTNQWHFYVVTNDTPFTNAAFATFLPPTLALPRMGVTNYFNTDEATRPEADIDLFVAPGEPGLTNLDPIIIASAPMSVTRGGTEVIVLTNSSQGAVYYVGVHSEDQQAAEYAFLAVFSLFPFSSTDSNGVQTVRGINVPADIPDGEPGNPGGAQIIGIALNPINIRRVVVTNTLSHEKMGDLFGSLNHARRSVVLNDHSCIEDPTTGFCFTNATFIFEDNGENDIPGSQNTDGPGSLIDFMGEEGQGLWLLTEVDNANGSTGRVEQLSIRLEPEVLNGDNFLDIPPFSFGFLAVDVPPEATNMTICVGQVNSTLPVQLFVRRDDLPTLTAFDYTKVINAPGDCLTISDTDLPPLTAGRYYIGVYNPNPVSIRVKVTITLGLNLKGVPTLNFLSSGPTPILDDAITYSSVFVTNASLFTTNRDKIVRAEVGVAIQHPRISDLVLTLISPTGKRILLSENRANMPTNDPGVSPCGPPEATNGWVRWDGAAGGNGHWYKAVINPGGLDWAAADQIAKNECGYLATITSPEENAFVFSLLTPAHFMGSGGNGSGPALGGIQPDNQLEPDGGWTWENGEPWSYTNWAGPTASSLQQPDNGNTPGPANPESRLQFWSGTNGVASPTWNDLGPNDQNLGGYIIEREDPVSYVVFTENTNNAHLPIKFESFTPTVITNFSLSDFEADTVQDYLAPATFGGWTVESNQVTVVNDPLTALAPGSKFLALANGTISRSLSVTPGARYTLNFATRGPAAVSMWSADGTLADRVDSNPGTLVNGATYGTGFVGPFAFQIDGIDDKVAVGDPNNLKLTNAFTIDAWINAAALPATQHGQIVFRGDLRGCLEPYYFAIQSSGAIRVHVEDTTGVFCGVNVDSPPIPLNQWVHVAGVFDGTTGFLGVYVNGALVAQQITAVKPFSELDTNSTPGVALGNHAGAFDSQTFNGRIDELTIYQRALSSSEIKAIYTAGAAGKYDATDPNPQNLSKASATLSGIRTGTFLAANGGWLNQNILFRPFSSPITFTLSGLEPGVLVDSFVLAQRPPEDFVFPEETLKDLVGDGARGVWTLEILDNRTGAELNAQLVNWQLRLILERSTPLPIPLFDHIPVTNSIPPCQTAFYYVDVPPWVNFVTNRLLFATAPVDVWFHQGTPPQLVNPPDTLFFQNATTGTRVMSTDTNFPPPPLIPGQRYFLAVSNSCANLSNVIVGMEVDFGVRFIELTNMIPYNATNSGASNVFDFYLYRVTPSAVRAQFEINFPSDRMTLSVRKGLPPPDLTSFDYRSANPGSNDELIVVITNSTPVALTVGDWYLTAVNISGNPVNYSIMASEWQTTGRPFSITNLVVNTNGLVLTWETLNGVHYFIQGIPSLLDTNWYAASFTLTETLTNGSLSYMIPLPSPFQYFRVVEGLSLIDVPQPPPTLSISFPSNVVVLNWFDSVTARYQVQWTPAFPVAWNNFSNIATVLSPPAGYFMFIDDGSQTGGMGGPRFYRLQQIIVP